MVLEDMLHSSSTVPFSKKVGAALATLKAACAGTAASLYHTCGALPFVVPWTHGKKYPLSGGLVGCIAGSLIPAVYAFHSDQIAAPTSSFVASMAGAASGAFLFGTAFAGFHFYRTFFDLLGKEYSGSPLTTREQLDQYVARECSLLGLDQRHITIDLAPPSRSFTTDHPIVKKTEGKRTLIEEILERHILVAYTEKQMNDTWKITLYKSVHSSGIPYDGHRVGVLIHELCHVKKQHHHNAYTLRYALFSEPGVVLYQIKRVLSLLYTEKLRDIPLHR